MIDISLKVCAGAILFSISNSYTAENKRNGLVNGHSGLGLANAAKRLELLYGKDQQLNIFTNNARYVVELELKTT